MNTTHARRTVIDYHPSGTVVTDECKCPMCDCWSPMECFGYVDGPKYDWDQCTECDLEVQTYKLLVKMNGPKEEV